MAAGLGWQSVRIRPVTNPTTRVSGLEAHDSSAAGSLLGQFRTNITAWLWLHADLYLHNGVAMRPVTDGEMRAGIQAQREANDGNEELDKVASVTAIPSKQRDFRGIFGDVEREIAAYKDMQGHTHNDPEQCLPLYRLMTWLDPQFEEAWTTGAMIFARDRSPGGTMRALSFLAEGFGENPTSIEIMKETAKLYITRKRDFDEAVNWLERARGFGYSHRMTLDAEDKDALEEAYRWLCLCYRNQGRLDDVRKTAEEGLKLFNDDKVLDRLYRNPEGPTRS